MPYDPEGVLGSINSILMAFLGLQVVMCIRLLLSLICNNNIEQTKVIEF